MRRRVALVLGGALTTLVIWGQACASNGGALAPQAPGTLHSAALSHGEPSQVAPASGPALTLEDFAPLLSLPEFRAAALAVEAADHKQAAQEVVQVLAVEPPHSERVRRFQFLLGRLWEKAGEPERAVEAYRASAQVPWDLSPYVALALGRVHATAGRHDQAMAELRQIPAEVPAYAEAQALLASVADATGDLDLAIAAYRATLASRSVAEPPGTALALATALVARAQRDGLGTAVPTSTLPLATVVPRQTTQAVLVEALTWARRARWSTQDTEQSAAALQVERAALAAMAPELRAQHEALSETEQLAALKALNVVRRFSDAEIIAQTALASLSSTERYGMTGCEIQIERARALAGSRQWGVAVDMLGETVKRCQDTDQRARALFTAGKAAFSDKRYSASVASYQQLEKDAPQHRLADDARLNAALVYLEMGVEARYTELLSTMAEDYPQGDMVLDGVFDLALRRMEKGDWSGAANVLDGAAAQATAVDKLRGTEYAGRERYFRARARMALGERDFGLQELETIISELPLSYYMLQAYSRLREEDPARAEHAMKLGQAKAEQDPFSFDYRPEFDSLGFRRALELLRQGEVSLAQEELAALHLLEAGTTPAVLWAVALLYDRAGAAELSHRVARGLLTDWLQRWPAGEWRRAWELAFPRPHHDMVRQNAQKNGVPEALVYGVMREESQFDEDVVSPAGAYGLMQVIPPTARHYGKQAGIPYSEAALKRPANNIAIGTLVLKSFTRPFEKDPLLCIPAYNAGPGRPKRWKRERPNLDFDIWVELIPFRETRRYTRRVLAARAAYGYLYDTDAAPETWLTLPLRFAE